MSARPVKRATLQAWTLADSYCFIATFLRRQHSTEPLPSTHQQQRQQQQSPQSTQPPTHHHHSHSQHGRLHQPNARRHFHDYFVTHLPSSSLHPDSSATSGPHHRLPRSASTPHPTSLTTRGPSPATFQPPIGISRETTVVRIPLRSAKHHFGVSMSRGTRRANEDAYQAGVIDLPAFAKRAPQTLTIGPRSAAAAAVDEGSRSAAAMSSRYAGENRGADSASGDPQVFYFGVFDGHGGVECSDFLKDSLHEYIQGTASAFELQSSLREEESGSSATTMGAGVTGHGETGKRAFSTTGNNNMGEVSPLTSTSEAEIESSDPSRGELPLMQEANRTKIGALERALVTDWKNLVGGYFRRFRPAHFSFHGQSQARRDNALQPSEEEAVEQGASIEEVIEYAFLKADFDFVSAQASKKDDDMVQAEKPLNESDILHNPAISPHPIIGGSYRFKGGSTCSIALISTPTPTPFWHPSSPCSLLVSHVGDTRILLCSTATGLSIPCTTDHHPSSPVESTRLRRYAATFVIDSFGEERMLGLANTRAFGDISSKRIGVSAEPELRRIEMGPAEFSFLVLMSDGVSGTLTDQEVVDIIKEAKTPDQGARDVVSFATEVSGDGDNATCLVIRLGGWERRLEGGLGSMGTREERDWRRQEAASPRMRTM
ncbi:hypothetical protein AJ80_09551 [Polytolypa hystricis UAMH7299]|uniref:PPM-type phosphatase domain-containing protein n=1 Tax=Polytolypa hystricis (strain UAMH7299) TaxID=1447883 RepID=A0A2B7WPC9_POLH7|nr:hypothetical protein AJ80_09551 [Polytolypa hystricis UAMH7299]